MLETLNYTIRIVNTPTFLYFSVLSIGSVLRMQDPVDHLWGEGVGESSAATGSISLDERHFLFHFALEYTMDNKINFIIHEYTETKITHYAFLS